MTHLLHNSLGLFVQRAMYETSSPHARFTPHAQPDGSLLNLNCAGPKHALFRDMDGTMAQSPVGTFIAGQFPAPGRTFPFDQGTPLPQGPCSYNAGIQVRRWLGG